MVIFGGENGISRGEPYECELTEDGWTSLKLI